MILLTFAVWGLAGLLLAGDWPMGTSKTEGKDAGSLAEIKTTATVEWDSSGQTRKKSLRIPISFAGLRWCVRHGMCCDGA